MSTKTLTLTAIILAFLACQLQAAVINSRWVGGTESEWGNPNNWNPPIVPDNRPGQTFAVTIDSDIIGVDNVIVHIQQNRTIDRLDCNGVVELTSWPSESIWLTLVDKINGLTNYGSLDVGGLNIIGNVKNSLGGSLQLQDRPNIKGDLYNFSGAKLEGGVEVEEGNIHNNGLVILKPYHDMWADNEFHNSGKILIMDGEPGSGGILYNHHNGIIDGFGKFCDGGQIIKNEGMIVASGGSMFFYDSNITNTGILKSEVGSGLYFKVPPIDFNNQDTIEVNANAWFVLDCNLVNEPNAVIKLLGGTLAAETITQKAGATFQGFGGITGNVVIEPNAIIKLTGPTNIVGDVEIREGATLDIKDGTVLVTGLTTCNGGTIQTYRGTIIMQGGTSGGICRRIFVD